MYGLTASPAGCRIERVALDAELRRRREEVVLRHVERENAHDTEGVIATFATPSYDVPAFEHLKPEGQAVTHPDEASVRAFLDGLLEQMPDLEVVVDRLHHADDAVIVEGRSLGGGTSLRCAVFYRFDGDRKVNETVYFDSATIPRQLGLEALPL
jgi:hypothetical protein